MKKVFALVFALGAMAAVFAQGGRNESRNVILGPQNQTVYNDGRTNNGRYDNGYNSVRDRDAQVARINREYNSRIESVKNDRYMRKSEKKREIRFLENERDQKIREVVRRYNNRNYSTNRGRY